MKCPKCAKRNTPIDYRGSSISAPKTLQEHEANMAATIPEMEVTSAVGRYLMEANPTSDEPCLLTQGLRKVFVGFKLLQCPFCNYVIIEPWNCESRDP